MAAGTAILDRRSRLGWPEVRYRTMGANRGVVEPRSDSRGSDALRRFWQMEQSDAANLIQSNERKIDEFRRKYAQFGITVDDRTMMVLLGIDPETGAVTKPQDWKGRLERDPEEDR